MGENSKIEWCDHTFNPWVGCSKVSTGCKNCYAENMMDKRFGRVQWGVSGTRSRTSAANWKKPLSWNRKAKEEGTRPRVFCGSLCDIFEDRPELVEWRRDLLSLIVDTPNLDWLLLTKRPENVNRMINEVCGLVERSQWFGEWLNINKHIWIGTSVENQETADKRIPELLKIPAAVRFLSAEPMLGPVVLARVPMLEIARGLHWVICGGESGANARALDVEWARSLRDRCVGAGVPFFFKQIDKKTAIPADLFIREFPEGR